jgi:hypothetical protein
MPPLKPARIRQIKDTIFSLHASGQNVSATNIQRAIKGAKLRRELLLKLVGEVERERSVSVSLATVRSQPGTRRTAEATYSQVRKFLIDFSLRRKPISPKLIKVVFGVRLETAEKIIARAQRDKAVIEALGGNRIRFLTPGQNHRYDLAALKRQYASKV